LRRQCRVVGRYFDFVEYSPCDDPRSGIERPPHGTDQQECRPERIDSPAQAGTRVSRSER
jgi:hypothetical protein